MVTSAPPCNLNVSWSLTTTIAIFKTITTISNTLTNLALLISCLQSSLSSQPQQKMRPGKEPEAAPLAPCTICWDFSPDTLCPWDFVRKPGYLSKRTDSGEIFLWARGQIDRCLTSDHNCGNDAEVELPMRVLAVGQEMNEYVKVLETRGEKGKYITLSHCWDDETHMTTKLTVHTKDSYEAGLSVEELPRTFQDAVHYTRRQGISYLWIDSLCIIQSDKKRDSMDDAKLSSEDWTSESARMSSAYENTYLTIAAASAKGCREGLFFDPKIIDLE
jgi:hypothetical protein